MNIIYNIMICLAKNNKIRKILGNGFDLIFSSTNNEFLKSNVVKLDIKFMNDNTDVSDMLFGSRYYLVVGGAQIYTNIYDEHTYNNIYPVNYIPFGLSSFHDIFIYFEILDDIIQQMLDQLTIIFNYDTFDVDIVYPSHIDGYIDINWVQVNDKPNYLKFISGMCGMTQTININNEDISKKIYTKSIKVNKYSGTIIKKSIDEMINNNNLYISATDGIYELIKNKSDFVYETMFYRFNGNDDSSNFKHFMNFDGLTNFRIISEKKLSNKPKIIINDIVIKCNRENIITNGDTCVYTYLCTEYDYTHIFNMICIFHKNNDLIVKFDIEDGEYLLQYHRIFMDSKHRRNYAVNHAYEQIVDLI